MADKKKKTPNPKSSTKCIALTTHSCNMGGRAYSFKKGETFEVSMEEDLKCFLDLGLAVEQGDEVGREEIKKKPSHL